MSVVTTPAGWDAALLRVDSDTARIARYRRLQSWYRELQLGVAEAGIGVNGRPVGRMLPAAALAARPDLNFLTPAAYDHARRRIQEVRNEGGTLDEDRLRRNLLSSMPLCFNLFGSLATHPAFLDLIRRLVDLEAADVVDVQCEWAPQPSAAHLGDRSAFDAFISYSRKMGASYFIGVETKYTEPFSAFEYDKPAYRRVTEKSGWFKEGAYDALRSSSTNQLWRTLMLAASMEDGDRFQRGRVVLLTCADDHRAVDCSAAVTEQLVDPSRLLHITFEAVVEAARDTKDSDLAAWADRFEQRYLVVGLPPIERTADREGPKLERPLDAPDRVFGSEPLPSPALVEALSWGLAARFARRHPQLRITEEHPCGGTYDCLTIIDAEAGAFDRVHLNRNGSGFVWRNANSVAWAWRGIWSELAATTNYRFAVQLLEHFTGLPPAVSTPPAQAHTVVYRLIAAILQAQVGAACVWRAALNLRGETWGLQVPDWIPNEPDQWILCRDGDPVICVSAKNALARRSDGTSMDVWSTYRTDRRISALMPAVLGGLAP